eukprot:Pgem_evm1s19460
MLFQQEILLAVAVATTSTLAFEANTFIPNNVKVNKGVVSPATFTPADVASILSKAESTLGFTSEQTTEAVYSTSFMFDSNATKGADIEFIFNTNKKQLRETMTSISVKSRYMGPKGAWGNLWTFFAYNYVNKRYEQLGDNSAAASWVWDDVSGNKTFKYVDNSFMSENGDMQIKYVTVGAPGSFDASHIDSMELLVHTGEPRDPKPDLVEKPKVTAPVLGKSNSRWTDKARICGLSIDPKVSEAVMQKMVSDRKKEGCSVLEVDSSLSYYHDEAAFDQQVRFLNSLSLYAKTLDLESVIYIPSLEVNVKGGCDQGNHTSVSMVALKNNQLQRKLDGGVNSFCGNLEHWVQNGEESAWFEPNNKEYREHFLGRITQLGRETALGGVWVDVPIYSDTSGKWAGAGPDAEAAFVAWCKTQGISDQSLPTLADMEAKNQKFKHWITWRHHSLDEWQDAMQKAAEAGRSNFFIAAEIYSVDYFDGYVIGLDGGYKTNKNQFRVWEVDSVSNSGAMNYATKEDWRNKIAMNKYATAADSGRHTWLFAYGNQELDAGLVLGAIAAVGASPFESKTPIMTDTVGSAFRTRWFKWLEQTEKAIMDFSRESDVGVLYSSPSRDVADSSGQYSCGYGMFAETERNPTDDEQWWAQDGDTIASRSWSSSVYCNHIGGYRGIMNALNKLQVLHKVVIDTTDGMQSLSGLRMIMLPNVDALSEEAAATIKTFVERGGVVYATGPKLPGTLDHYGNPHATPVLKELFPDATDGTAYVKAFGKGVAFYRPAITTRSLFEGFTTDTVGQPNAAAYAQNLNWIEETVRQHVAERVIVSDRYNKVSEDVYIELGTSRTNTQQAIYLLNLEGAQQPVQEVYGEFYINYKAPDGTKIKSVSVYSPDKSEWQGTLENVQSINNGQWYSFPLVRVDQFATIVVNLEKRTTPVSPVQNHQYPDGWKEAIADGFNFIKNKMRNHSAPAPLKYGIYTALQDTDVEDVVYANGHHMTAEHMGLFLRVAACMGDEEAHKNGFDFVNELMMSKAKSIINWAVDKNTGKPFLQTFGEAPNKMTVNANAPLDDSRAIRAIIAGARLFGHAEASDLAARSLRGLYWTSVTNRQRGQDILKSKYDGVIGYSYDWSEGEEKATGFGNLGFSPLPIDYNLLWTMNAAAGYNPRWKPILETSIQMLLDSEIPQSPGLFYNGLNGDGSYTGDFEYRDLVESNRGKHLKSIQTLWIGIHLAEIGVSTTSAASADLRKKALEAATRCLNFYKAFYSNGKRIPEYMTFAGKDVPMDGSGDALKSGENLVNGEARIYAQLARMAYILGDVNYAKQVVNEKLMTDIIKDKDNELYGFIGKSTADQQNGKPYNAESFNTLESLVTMCMISGGNDGLAGAEFIPFSDPNFGEDNSTDGGNNGGNDGNGNDNESRPGNAVSMFASVGFTGVLIFLSAL